MFHSNKLPSASSRHDSQWRFVDVTDADIDYEHHRNSFTPNTAPSSPPYPQTGQNNFYATPQGAEAFHCREPADFSYANVDVNWHTSPSTILDDDQSSLHELSYHQPGHSLEMFHGLHAQSVGNGGYDQPTASTVFMSTPVAHNPTLGYHPGTGGTVPMPIPAMPYCEPHHSEYHHDRISRHASTATVTGVESYSQAEPSVPLDGIPGNSQWQANPPSPNTCQWDRCGQQLSNVTLRGVREHLRERHFKDRAPPMSGKDLIECRWGGNCGRDKMQWENLPKHIAECHFRSMTRVCEQCGGSFARGDTLRRHQESGGCFQGRRPTN
ncbi:hypothetical protein ACG7TL_001414 [Trametes sanguinea]